MLNRSPPARFDLAWHFATLRASPNRKTFPFSGKGGSNLGATKVLRQDEAARCAALLHGAMDVTQIASRASNQLPGAEERSSLLAVAAWIRQLRLRVLRGEEVRLNDPPVLKVADFGWRRAIEPLFRAGSALVAPGSISTGSRQKGLLLAADWSTNPVYTSFALRATLATMGSYVFMTLTDWTEIHTCISPA